MSLRRRSSISRHLTTMRATSLVPLLVLALLSLVATPAHICYALPTYAATPSSAAASRDHRVKELRHTLQTEHHLERLPDPPLELGIHTACKKFGRGCPDTYVAFLEDVVASLRALRGEERRTENSENDSRDHLAAPADQSCEDAVAEPRRVVDGRADKGGEHAATTASALTTVNQDAGSDAPLPPSPAATGFATSSSPSSSVSYTLSLPVQPSWTYAEYKRLSNLLVRLRVAEAQLGLQGIATHDVQHRHQIPRAEALVLHDDPTGVVAAQVSAVCAALRQGHSDSPLLPFSNSSAEERAAYATWCGFLERRRLADSDGAFDPFSRLPTTPLQCWKLDLRRWHAHALLMLDPILSFLLSWTWSVALPSAVVTSVVLWVCVGDGLGDAAEQMIFDVSPRTAGGEKDGDDPQRAAEQDALLLDEQYRASRLASLRYIFVERVLHRSWFTSFLKVRLVLCLLVALDFLWSFGQVLHATLQPAAASNTANQRVTLSISLNILLRVMPTWMRVVANVYLLVVAQGAVLIMALKGAAGAYADWQDFMASCAAEQEYLLAAVDDAAHPMPSP